MSLMAWSHHFETGLPTVDRQHRALVDLVNTAAPLLASAGDSGLQKAGHLLDELTRYALVHFRDEEQLMHDEGLDPAYLDKHHRTHQAFGQSVAMMRQQASQAGQLTGSELLRFLTSWLAFHILAEDQCMARQIKAIRAGQTPPQAWAQEMASQSDGPHAVYTEALLDLFGVVTHRNKTLLETNTRLQQTQAELAQANSGLEARVAARTAELAQANEHLRTEQAALTASLAQLRHTQQQLLQSEKMAAVGQLAAGVAHEINNPIGFVNANLSTLGTYTTQLLAIIDAQGTDHARLAPLSQTATTAAAAEQLAYLKQDIPDLLHESHQGLERVTRIVADLLKFAHTEAMAPEPVDLVDALESALSSLPQDLLKNVSVTRSLAPLPPVVCRPAEMQQVLVNLLTNACQAMETQGSLYLESGLCPVNGQPGVWLSIRDTGVGMTPDVQKRVFEPFFTTKPVGQGTGLGLSVTWDMVQRHGGNVQLTSAPQQGTTVRLELPCQPPPRP